MLSLVGAWAVVHLRPRNIVAAAPLALFRWAHAPVGAVLLALIYAQALWQPFKLEQAIDRTRDMRGWKQMEADVSILAAALGGQWTVVAGDYGLTGELATYARINRDPRPVWQLDEMERYGFRPPIDTKLLTQPAMFVANAGSSVDLPLQYFAKATLAGTVDRTQPGEVLQQFDVFLVSDPLPATVERLTHR
jgi:hypothetical protein